MLTIRKAAYGELSIHEMQADIQGHMKIGRDFG